MPSKGIDVYSYVSPSLAAEYEVKFNVPGEEIRNDASANFTKGHLEVDSKNIHGAGRFTGRFQWTVFRRGVEIASAYNDINALTGNLHGGTMLATQTFFPIVSDDAIITYGFYDAGHGEAGLTSHDQCYVTICPTGNRSWMGALAPPGSQAAEKPFSRFALVAPHDNGMNSMQSSDAILQAIDSDMVEELKKLIPRLQWFSHIPNSILVHMLPNVVYGLAVTQKKEITTMLRMGARYFEFRPAELLPMFQEVSKLPNKFYFQHACIPGLAFDAFLEAQVSFLDSHPNEITVIHIRNDNIVSECKLPSSEEVAGMLDQACSKATQYPLTWGDHTCFSESIDKLRSMGRRLICISMADKYDSYSHEAYATLAVDPIIARFEQMDTEGQLAPTAGDLTILQCQGTSQAIKEVLLYSVIASNAATSCLTSTKAAFDSKTLPWIRENAAERLRAEKLMVIMNDFLDGATCDTGIELSHQRLSY